ncbi:MAG: hypothetical protein BGO10_08900 [Chlamydia sp. 32-24]|nr:MAG: hypothetical protein BGO10_08900 [Chlamydia sp. 32-24]
MLKVKESNVKLLSFLKLTLLQSYSNKQIKKGIESNFCKINGKIERFASTILLKGDVVEFDIEGFKGTFANDSLNKVPILYEDEDFLACNKPDNIASDSDELVKRIASSSKIYLVHRLDKDTTGVLLFAKSEQALKAIIEQFRLLHVTKEYLAIVDGIPNKEKGKISNNLSKIKSLQGQSIWGVTDEGLKAITYWEQVVCYKNASLIRCFPKTGRTHQLRVHLAGMKHPIIGDYQYGYHSKYSFSIKRPLLHAFKLKFVHYRTGNEVSIKAPLPDDFEQILKKLHLPCVF